MTKKWKKGKALDEDDQVSVMFTKDFFSTALQRGGCLQKKLCDPQNPHFKVVGTVRLVYLYKKETPIII